MMAPVFGDTPPQKLSPTEDTSTCEQSTVDCHRSHRDEHWHIPGKHLLRSASPEAFPPELRGCPRISFGASAMAQKHQLWPQLQHATEDSVKTGPFASD